MPPGDPPSPAPREGREGDHRRRRAEGGPIDRGVHLIVMLPVRESHELVLKVGELYAVKLSERTYRIPVRAVIGLLEPERLAPSSITVEPEADVEQELMQEHEVETVSA